MENVLRHHHQWFRYCDQVTCHSQWRKLLAGTGYVSVVLCHSKDSEPVLCYYPLSIMPYIKGKMLSPGHEDSPILDKVTYRGKENTHSSLCFHTRKQNRQHSTWVRCRAGMKIWDSAKTYSPDKTVFLYFCCLKHLLQNIIRFHKNQTFKSMHMSSFWTYFTRVVHSHFESRTRSMLHNRIITLFLPRRSLKQKKKKKKRKEWYKFQSNSGWKRKKPGLRITAYHVANEFPAPLSLALSRGRTGA